MVTHVVNKLEVVKYLTKVYGTNKGDIHNIPAVGKTSSMIIIANHWWYWLYSFDVIDHTYVFHSTSEKDNSDDMIERLREIMETGGNNNTTSLKQEDDISIKDEMKKYCARIPKQADYGYQYKLFWVELFILSDIIKP